MGLYSFMKGFILINRMSSMSEMKKILFRLKIEYVAIWFAAILLVILFESDCLLPGGFAGEDRIVYLAQTLSILITLGCIPLALKLFSIDFIRKRLSVKNDSNRLVAYRFWSEVRMCLLVFPLIVNLLLYYLTMEISSAYCALIVVLAMLFCWPSEVRLVNETSFCNAVKTDEETINKGEEKRG